MTETRILASNSADDQALIALLQARFEANMHRHPSTVWGDVRLRLENRPEKIWSLRAMEATGGEPDVIGCDPDSGEFLFCDCAPESPKGRRSICYDHIALEARKENKPADSAVNMANEMGIELLSEAQYLALQQKENFDTKTSSWIRTPDDVRNRGGALFGDRRYGRVFFYHNGAESYYAARGFRGLLKV